MLIYTYLFNKTRLVIFLKLIDCHTHTQFSVDSEADIESCTERAASLGLAAYAITDHCECNAWYAKEHYDTPPNADHFSYGTDFEASVSAVTALKQRYAGRLDLICGTELGQITHAPEIAEKVNSDKRVDFIIGSVHQVMGKPDFYYIEYRDMPERDIYDLLERYFREVYDVCLSGIPDVIGHLTYCLRYMKQRCGICPDISRFDDIIAESFNILIQNGRGIEINTSGLRQGFGATFPDLKYVKLFNELGGEVISLGSDAHTAEDIGKNIADGAEIAREAGFRYITCFKERKPVFIKI